MFEMGRSQGAGFSDAQTRRFSISDSLVWASEGLAGELSAAPNDGIYALAAGGGWRRYSYSPVGAAAPVIFTGNPPSWFTAAQTARPRTAT
jgi:hypothetical protein